MAVFPLYRLTFRCSLAVSAVVTAVVVDVDVVAAGALRGRWSMTPCLRYRPSYVSDYWPTLRSWERFVGEVDDVVVDATVVVVASIDLPCKERRT